MRTLPTPKPPQPTPRRPLDSGLEHNSSTHISEDVSHEVDHHSASTTADLDALISRLWPRSAGTAIANRPYTSDHPMDLSFEKGEDIEILGREDAAWWNGRSLKSGHFGSFPSSFVDLSSVDIPVRPQQRVPLVKPLPRPASNASSEADLTPPPRPARSRPTPSPSQPEEILPSVDAKPPPLPRRPTEQYIDDVVPIPPRPNTHFEQENTGPKVPPRPGGGAPAMPPRPQTNGNIVIPPRPPKESKEVVDGDGEEEYNQHPMWRILRNNPSVRDPSYNGPPLEFTEEMFTDVDDHARRTPVHLASKVSTLAHYLTSPYRDSPLYKIRAIFSWIAQNIAYDVQSFSGWQNGKNISASQNPDHVLKSKMSVCEGYAGLFYALMSAGAPEIECYKVSGAANGAGTEPGDGFMELEGHAWNIVKVCGEYRIIESTWGTGNVSGSKFNRALNPFYFLTRPEQIIPTHFPKVPSFQFLERPLTHFEWMRLPSIREQDFWRYGISLQSVSGHTLDGTGGMMSFLRTNEGRLDLVFKASLDACSVDGEQLAFMAELEFFAEDRPIPNKEVLWVDGYTRRPGITRSQIKVACQYYTLPGPSGTFFGYVNLRFPDVGQGRLLIYITKTKPFQEVFQYNGSPLKFRVENTLPAHMMEPIPERPEAWNVKGAQLIKPYRKYLSVGETVTFIVSAPSGPVNDVYVGHQEHIMRGDAFGSSSGSGGGVEFGWGGIMGRMVGGTRGAMNSSVTYLKEEERGSGLITCTVTIAKSGEWWLVVGLQNSSFTYIAKFQAQ